MPPTAMRDRHGNSGVLRTSFRQIARAMPDDSRRASKWSVDVISYEYRHVDHFDRELLIYYWHPEAAGPGFPHIHVSASLDGQLDALTRRELPLDKCYVARGWVEVHDVVRMFITDSEVRPLCPEWQQRLAHAFR